MKNKHGIQNTASNWTAALLFLAVMFGIENAQALSPALYPATYANGIRVDTAAIGTRTPLILIHGIQSSPNMWDTFLHYWAASPGLQSKFKPYLFGYSTDESSLRTGDPTTILGLSQRLGYYLQERYDSPADSISSGFGDKPVMILAHSMGGLVARSMMQNYGFKDGKRGGDKVLRLITLATPHHGTPLANKRFSFSAGGSIFDLFDDWLADGFGNDLDIGFSLDLSWDCFDGYQFYGYCGPWLSAQDGYRTENFLKIIAYAAQASGLSVFTPLGLGADMLTTAGYDQNDGMVPIQSALFNGATILARRLVNGSCDHSAIYENLNTVTITIGAAMPVFGSISNDLVSAIPLVQAPSITSVSPSTLAGLPSPQTRRITIAGSGFTSSSVLIFNNGVQNYNSDPARLTYISSTEIKYDIAVGTPAATWTVKVVNGSVESDAYTFHVTAAADNTAPSAPIGLTASPSPWSKNNLFNLDWTNPNDPSGIAKVWWKLGSAPASATDGLSFRLPAFKPLPMSLSQPEGTQMIYVWLEDGAGNKNRLNNAPVTLRLDTTRPAIAITSHSPAVPYSSTQNTITLSGIFSDNLSGVTSVTWFNNSGGNGVATSGTGLSGNWSTPAITLYSGVNNITVTAIDAAGNVGSATIQVNYLNTSNSGTVNVTINPQAAATAGALWHFAGETFWRLPGVVGGIAAGNRTVEFKAVDNWITPQAIIQNVLANQPTSFTGQYVANTVTQAPDVPSNPYPFNGAGNIPRSGLTLTWSGSHPTGSPDFAVRFGTENPPPFRAGFGTVPGHTYSPYPTEPLLPGTTYYWGVRAKVGDQITDGPVWRFTTEYSYADLIPYEIVVDGNIEPGATVTVHVKVKNQGTFTSAASCPLKLYLSQTPQGREQRLNQFNTLYVPALVPGAEAELQQNVTLKNLQAGQSFIDAWVDSAPYGVNENDYQNNVQSLAINYIDGKNPVVTFAGLANLFVKTGQANSIVYSATDDVAIKTVDFYYSTNSGLDWTPIAEGYVPPTPPTYGAVYPWLLPTNLPVGANLDVRVVARDTSGNSGETNAGPYLIRSGTAPTVTVLSPNGGELWNMGSQQQISWNLSAPNGVTDFRVYFYRNNTIDYLPGVPLPSGNGTYTWTLPTPLSTTNGLIRIYVQDLNGNTAEDYSDGYFTVRDTSAAPPAPWIDPIPATSTAGGDPGGTPRIATDTTGTAHLVYGLSHNGSAKTVTFRYKKRLNGAWTSATPVTLDMQSSDNQLGVSYSIFDWNLAVDTIGNPHLVWATGYSEFSEWNKAEVFYAYFNGSAWSQPQNLSQTVLGGYATSTLSWQTKANCPTTESYEAAVANNKLYVFANGGVTYEYNPTGNQWTTKASAPGGISGSGAAEVNGLIYDLNISGNVIQIYNPANNSWSTGASIPTPRDGMSIVAVGGKVFAIGGSNSRTVEAYDPQGNNWSTKADMPTARQYAAAAVVNGKIYVIGGSGNGNQLSTVEVYDPPNNTWTVIPKPIVATWPVRDLAVAVTLNNRIYLIGGRRWNTYQATVDEFDPATSTWQPMNPMTMARGTAVAGVIQSQIIIVGGSDGSSRTASAEMATITGTVNGAISGSPTIAVDSNNKVHVVWQDGSYIQPDVSDTVFGFAFVGQTDIYHASKLSGQSWSLPSRLTTSSGRFSTIAIGGTNYLHLAYVTGNAIGYKRWDGTTWSSQGIVVSNANVSFSYPRLAANTNNQLHSVWKSYDQVLAREQIDYAYFDSTGWSGKESVAGPGSVNYPTVGVDSFNRPHITWEEWANTAKIYHSGKTAGLWSPRIQLNRDAQNVSDHSSGAALCISSNELHVVWNSSVSGNTEVIYNHANVGSTNDIFGPAVSVTAPALSANLSIGSSFPIQWNATDNTGVTTVSIDYSMDNGSSWTLVTTNQANSGTFAWIVPNLGTNAGQVRVTARDAAGNSGVGFSGTFTTTDLTPPTITITAPTNGATLIGDATNNVVWTATDNAAVARIDLEYSLNNGASWSDMATNLSNGGSYPWLIPNSATTVLLIRATARDTAGLSASATTQPITIVRANNPPMAPSSPFPLNGSTFVLTVSPQFSWSSSDLDGDPLTYQIRFGTNATPPIVSSGSAPSFAPGFLRPQRTYYWQVLVSDGKTTTTGPLWSFTTEAGALPSTVLEGHNRTTNGGFQFRVSGLFGESYAVQASTNLAGWQTLTNFINTNAVNWFLDTTATNFPRRFYRVIEP